MLKSYIIKAAVFVFAYRCMNTHTHTLINRVVCAHPLHALIVLLIWFSANTHSLPFLSVSICHVSSSL